MGITFLGRETVLEFFFSTRKRRCPEQQEFF